jgi:acyl dehydratase
MSSARALAFVISAGESGRFAELSGGFNPIHIDPLLARRPYSEEIVVHGCAFAITRPRPVGRWSAPSHLYCVPDSNNKGLGGSGLAYNHNGRVLGAEMKTVA